MRRFSARRRIGIGAAWVAAYAFALNILIASALSAASLSPSLPGGALCLPSAAHDTAAPGDAGLSSGVHCPACIIVADIALPPPAQPILVTRWPIVAACAVARIDTPRANPRTTDNFARGPPRLI